MTTDRERFPLANALVREIEDAGPLLAPSMQWLRDNRGEAFWHEAERIIGYATALGGKPLEALAQYTFMTIKEQLAYDKTGRYSGTDFEEVRKAVYDNSDVMEGWYLEGLLMTHAFWPIHFDTHRFFGDAFLSRMPDRGVGLEVGFGHGLYLLDALTHRPGTRSHSFDLSDYAIAYADRLLGAGGIDKSRYELGKADVREPLPVEASSQSWAIFAEVLEHIPHPAAALRELARVLEPGAPLFATTVLFSNAIDHLYEFESAEEVEAMFRETGFSVVESRALRVTDYMPGSKNRTVDLLYVCERAS